MESLTKILEGFTQAFHVIINILLLSLLYDILKMDTIETETCLCNKQKYTAEHLYYCAFVGFWKYLNLP